MSNADGLSDCWPAPYYAVVFSSTLNDYNDALYGEMAQKMVDLAAEQPGYLGIESAREKDGIGISVSYWESLEAIKDWREQADHIIAQKLGRERFYKAFRLRVAKVEYNREMGS